MHRRMDEQGTIVRIRGLENFSTLRSVRLDSGEHTFFCLKSTVDSDHGVTVDGAGNRLLMCN